MCGCTSTPWYRDTVLPFRFTWLDSSGGPRPLRGRSRLHTDTPASVLRLWTSDQRVADNTHMRHTSLTAAGLEPAVSASERPQPYALDGTATVSFYFAIIMIPEKIYINTRTCIEVRLVTRQTCVCSIA
jgi:hypothetical protein